MKRREKNSPTAPTGCLNDVNIQCRMLHMSELQRHISDIVLKNSDPNWRVLF